MTTAHFFLTLALFVFVLIGMAAAPANAAPKDNLERAINKLNDAEYEAMKTQLKFMDDAIKAAEASLEYTKAAINEMSGLGDAYSKARQSANDAKYRIEEDLIRAWKDRPPSAREESLNTLKRARAELNEAMAALPKS